MQKLKVLIHQAVILAIPLLCAILSGCSEQKYDYRYNWLVKTTYTNGDIDTLKCSYKSFEGRECYLDIKISTSGLLSSVETQPCLIMGCSFWTEVVACGVRKYEVIALDKVSLK